MRPYITELSGWCEESIYLADLRNKSRTKWHSAYIMKKHDMLNSPAVFEYLVPTFSSWTDHAIDSRSTCNLTKECFVCTVWIYNVQSKYQCPLPALHLESESSCDFANLEIEVTGNPHNQFMPAIQEFYRSSYRSPLRGLPVIYQKMTKTCNVKFWQGNV